MFACVYIYTHTFKDNNGVGLVQGMAFSPPPHMVLFYFIPASPRMTGGLGLNSLNPLSPHPVMRG